MRTYDSYKDSGLEWIGEIPEHWEVRRLKYVANSVQTGKTPSTSIEAYFNNEDYDWFTPGDFGSDLILKNSNRKISQLAVDQEGLKLFEPNTVLLVAIGATLGKIGIVLETCFSNQQLNAITFNQNKIIPFYGCYFFYCTSQIIVKNSVASTLAILNQEKTKELIITVPPLSEQTAIANYLDTKTTEIDQTIADKEALVNLYEEEKKALINEAVTKGLNPNVTLKPSGIDWLGDVPEHWEVKRLKYVAEIVLGKMLTPEDKGDYSLKPYLRAQNIQWLNVDTTDVKEMWFSNSELESYQIKENDILVSEGGEVGRACIWKNELDECYIQNSVNKVSIKAGEPYFYLYQFYILGAKYIFNSIVNKVSIAHLTKEKLKEIPFVVAPLEEQTTIVQYIETESAKINDKITLAKQEIALLKEYRQALIFEAVTGKICVL
jgi:type I restriction enzyme S subunit